MSLPIQVSFADLTHTGQHIAVYDFPLGILYVASYAQRELGDQIDFEVFKHPDDFDQYLESNTPKIACFSAFTWNMNLGHAYAQKIKAASPETITVFGGPNFPADRDEQKEFLTKFSAIDFYIEFEGEIPLVELFNSLREVDFDGERFKKARTITHNIRYLVDDELVAGDLAPKVRELDDLPSPYLTGVADKFFNGVFIPMLQTTRGCPYSCTFCWEGGDYFQKTTRFSQERITGELEYMSQRVADVPELCITDANFGIFKQDIETTLAISQIQKNHSQAWPKVIRSSTAKNHKERTIEIVSILGETLPGTAAVQSTDEEVLKHIKRKNVSLDALVTFAKATGELSGQTRAEIILCLEGDSTRAHLKSIWDMVDAKMTSVVMFQFILLLGTQASSNASREKFGIESRYRILPRCHGTYSFRGQTFPVAEIEEIVVANNTMSFDEYQACRAVHLTVEVFHNDLVFAELVNFLEARGVSPSSFIEAVHQSIQQGGGPLLQLYSQFRSEEQGNLWKSLEEAESFVQEPGVIERYIKGELGSNELTKYRVLAIFQHMEEMHEVAFDCARKLLHGQGHGDDQVALYLDELREFSQIRKLDFLDAERTERREFHFDFPRLTESKFAMDPLEAACPEGISLELYHTEEQRDLANAYSHQYGSDLVGLGRLLVRAKMNRLYRNVRAVKDADPVAAPGS